MLLCFLWEPQAVTFAIRTRRWWYNWEGLVTADEAWQSWYLDAPCKLSILFIFFCDFEISTFSTLAWMETILPQKPFQCNAHLTCRLASVGKSPILRDSSWLEQKVQRGHDIMNCQYPTKYQPNDRRQCDYIIN